MIFDLPLISCKCKLLNFLNAELFLRGHPYQYGSVVQGIDKYFTKRHIKCSYHRGWHVVFQPPCLFPFRNIHTWEIWIHLSWTCWPMAMPKYGHGNHMVATRRIKWTRSSNYKQWRLPIMPEKGTEKHSPVWSPLLCTETGSLWRSSRTLVYIRGVLDAP